VGIGDRVGRTETDLLWRCCRRDGVIVKPDAPIAALDRCFRAHVLLEPVPLLAATHSQHTAGRWVYAVSLHASNHDGPLRFRFETSVGATREKQFLLVSASADGITGHAECVADADPFYLPETNATALHVLRDFLAR